MRYPPLIKHKVLLRSEFLDELGEFTLPGSQYDASFKVCRRMTFVNGTYIRLMDEEDVFASLGSTD